MGSVVDIVCDCTAAVISVGYSSTPLAVDSFESDKGKGNKSADTLKKCSVLGEE